MSTTMEAARRPVIGISRCSRLDDYVSSVEASGGRVRVLEVSESPAQVVKEIHGLLLTGGGDIDPVFYGEQRHDSITDAEPGRDEFEIDLARRALDARMPILAICRGSQVVNVAAGGTLVQDIPSAVQTDLTHTLDTPTTAIAHEVRIAPVSRLGRALGPAVTAAGSCVVNSRHHQAVGRLGRGLEAVANAPDGVIEAIEAPEADFCVGVQWHPENFHATGEFKSLFDAFVRSARQRVADTGSDHSSLEV
jgi:putative glutamine amidotransferase